MSRDLDQKLHDLISSLSAQTPPDVLQNTWNEVLTTLLGGATFLVPATPEGSIPTLKPQNPNASPTDQQILLPVFTSQEILLKAFPSTSVDDIHRVGTHRLYEFADTLPNFLGVLINVNPLQPTDFQLALQASEIRRMRDFEKERDQEPHSKAPQEVLYREPQEFPQNLADALSEEVATNLESVTRMWLQEASIDGRHSYLVVVETPEADQEHAFEKLASVLPDVKDLKLSVGFAGHESNIGEALTSEVEPFYVRSR